MKIDFSIFQPEDFLPKMGITCPKLELLQTGDLLFPRLPEKNIIKSRNISINNKFKKINLGQYLKSDVKTLLETARNKKLNERRSQDFTTLVAEFHSSILNADKKSNISLYANQQGANILNQTFGDDRGVGLNINDFLTSHQTIKLLLKILIAAGYEELIENWFKVDAPDSVFDFMTNSLVQLLLQMLTASDVRTNLFLGHVGIVIKENDNVYVIEDNITSYSHYRVSIHPYYDKSDESNTSKYLNEAYNEFTKLEDKSQDGTDYDYPASRATGWVNRRSAMLEHVWHVRPKCKVDGWQMKLANAAKALHGRPYGFFDSPNLGNDDRMYCSEYVYTAFKQGLGKSEADNLLDKMTWGHVLTYLKNDGNAEMEKIVSDILTKHSKKITEVNQFFVLPPALLWNSSYVDHQFNPMSIAYAASPDIS